MPEPLELLVLAKKTGGAEAGMVIEVRRSPAVWGSHESIREWVRQGFRAEDFPGKYRVVKTSALSWEEARRLLEPDIQLVDAPSLENPDIETPQPVAVRIRKALINVDDLPPAVKTDFAIDDGRDAIPPARRALLLNAIKDSSDKTKGVDITKEIVKPSLPEIPVGNPR